MRTVIASSIVAAALAAFPGAALARPKPVTGSLSAKGYTLIALGYNGKATSVQVKGRFKLVPPAKKFTLHLRAASGKYAGPVVVGGKGKTVVLGLKPGAKLGKLKLGRGFARPAKALPASMIDKSRTAKARKGVPIGAGVYGLVRSAAKGAAGAGLDPDRDGVPGAFDVDDNGNMVIDNQDPAATGPKARKADGLQAPAGGDTFRLFSNFHFDVSQTLNANAGGVTPQQIDNALTDPAGFVGLVFPVPQADSVELDCGGLTYCSLGGTGYSAEPYPNGLPFPASFDQDGDGLGTISAGQTGDFQLRTRAPSDKIGSGDTFIERVVSGGVEHDLTGVLNYIFNTTPAVKDYAIGDDPRTTISYPVGAGAGTRNNPFVLHPAANGDLTMTFEFWRPQRRAIPGTGEGDGFVDIGGLNYQLNVPNAPVTLAPNPGAPVANPPRGPQTCGSGAVSSSDPSLSAANPSKDPNSPYALRDGAGDRPADPANTLTFTVDFTKCLGQAGLTLQPGQQFGFEIQALSEVGDNAAQGFTACLPNAGETSCPKPSGPPPAN